MRPHPALHVLALLALAGGLGAATVGCGAATPRPDAAIPAAGRTRVAVLPFDNLTPDGSAGDLLTLVFFTELGSRGDYEPIESGIVAATLESLGVRSTSSLAADQLRAIGAGLGAERLLLGSVLESGTVSTGQGELPTVGVSLKLLDAASGRVLWTKMGFKSGDDGETVFGWGREKSPRKLAARLAAELLRGLPSSGADGTVAPLPAAGHNARMTAEKGVP